MAGEHTHIHSTRADIERMRVALAEVMPDVPEASSRCPWGEEDCWMLGVPNRAFFVRWARELHRARVLAGLDTGGATEDEFVAEVERRFGEGGYG